MQKTIFEENSFNQLPYLIADLGYQSVFVICIKHFSDKITGLLLESFRFQVYIKEGVNVNETESEYVCSRINMFNPEIVLAIGGGSVIDLAKSFLYKRTLDKLKVPYFVAIPTTSGSGTEATKFAVMYRNKKKISIEHPLLLPKLVVLDPEITYSLPATQSAISGADVFSQAIESYWSKRSNHVSQSFSKESIKIWSDNFLGVIKSPGKLSRRNMLWASHLSGKAINITKTTGPHALSYYLTSNYQIPHGQAVALFLPLFFLYNDPSNELLRIIKCETAYEAFRKIRFLFNEAGLAIRLSDISIDKKLVLEPLLNDFNEERFLNNPVTFDKEKLTLLINEYL